ncbi:MAG: PLP-dependent aminotransferase family protein [Sporichthyaceae bacterium]|nr:PLP-dependent aminotransferase family protein [Sporichthyaceae bacterium]
MDVHVSLIGRGELTAQIYRQLQDAVLDGRLRPGQRLPPSRELARQLEVSRNTVAAAYDRLTAEGFLVGQVGAGTFVAAAPLTKSRSRKAPGGRGIRPRPLWETLPVMPPIRPLIPAYNFRVGIPDGRLFPLQAWRRLISRELRPATLSSTEYREPAGRADLRAAIARHIGVARSVRAGPEDVLVTNGAQQAMDLIGRVLIEPGSQVAVEEPGYPPVRRLLQSLGARVIGVPVDAHGLDVAAIPRGVRLVYVTPSHQFPLGTAMSLARRAALLAWAERRRAVVIEDDYDSEFRFSARPLEPLQSLDRSGRVVYVGSFAKTLLPTLRLGFLVAPASLQPALLSAKQLTDWHGELSTQGALARFIDEGLLVRHIRKANREYAQRHERIVDTLDRDFAGWLQVVPSTAGLHVCARLRPGVPLRLGQVLARAEADGVVVNSLARYCAERPGQSGLLLGYGAIRVTDIDEGLRRLASAFEQVGPLAGR